ncbi:hypothetical protein MTAT_03310 [Moorella thermoacetica]|uniref:Cyclic di-GMP phosphodiesterase response regulator RpfG n=1 Tax=Neomoorella thermoacetica TaxID=1525 RepID=A0AAC9HJM8_NEOTH|nr:HD domain-containing phosphohydrolase [Moorella thermoacetica]AOQ24860.1 Cyclic di-GMP phosphodiesterase response regulator RpfG [Moorella thermoacetica]TYL15598.1 hypothetical protein MTAT_03310 [Moorella thermoacetica]
MKKTRLNRQQGQAAELTGTATTGQPFKEGELAFPEIVAVAAAKEKLLLHIREMEELYKVLHKRVQELDKARREHQDMFLAAMETLARTLEAKDGYTRGHSERVSGYAVHLASRLGLEKDTVEKLRLAASLHDLGKIGIHDTILNKATPLTATEFALIKQHPDIGARILQPMAPLKELLPWIRHHHERYDGMGYPDGLRGEAIPLGARIIPWPIVSTP